MTHISGNCAPWWTSHGHHFPQYLSKNLSLRVGSSSQPYEESNQLALLPQIMDSSPSQSTGQSHQEETATEGTNSQDKCISSDSVQDESNRKSEESQMKAILYRGNPNFVVNHPQVDNNPSVSHLPYAYADPYFNGLFNAYGPQAMIQPLMVGIAPARIPLPLELSEDGPIYVNSKQYQGILRRRQARAKLEAQNILVKNRKPYLHESRHRHALNRVRGSGGRFLPTKKSQNSKPTHKSSSIDASDLNHSYRKGEMSEFEVTQYETSKGEAPNTSCSTITQFANADAAFQQSSHGYFGISSHVGEALEMRGNVVLLSNGNYNRASIVR